MPTAFALRSQIEAALAERIPAALTPAPRMFREVAPTGVASVDALLDGGLPVGALTEVTGAECSGRTALALSFVAQLTRAEKVCAWVDVSDALSPESAAGCGVDLARLLWVRCGVARRPISETPDAGSPMAGRNGFAVPEKYFVAKPAVKGLHGGGMGGHPRGEAKGMEAAVGRLFQPDITARCAEPQRRVRRAMSPDSVDLIGGAKEGAEKSGKHVAAATAALIPKMPEGVGTKVPAYQVPTYEVSAYPIPSFSTSSKVPRCSDMREQQLIRQLVKPAATPKDRQKPWGRMEQAIRVTDLLLQAGGFAAIVLDMGSVAAEHVSRVPLATWFRYRAGAERTRASVVLLTQHACAQSSAGLVVRMEGGDALRESTVLTGFERRVAVSRQRFARAEEKVVTMRKPPQRADVAMWRSQMAWTRER